MVEASEGHYPQLHSHRVPNLRGSYEVQDSLPQEAMSLLSDLSTMTAGLGRGHSKEEDIREAQRHRSQSRKLEAVTFPGAWKAETQLCSFCAGFESHLGLCKQETPEHALKRGELHRPWQTAKSPP